MEETPLVRRYNDLYYGPPDEYDDIGLFYDDPGRAIDFDLVPRTEHNHATPGDNYYGRNIYQHDHPNGHIEHSHDANYIEHSPLYKLVPVTAHDAVSRGHAVLGLPNSREQDMRTANKVGRTNPARNRPGRHVRFIGTLHNNAGRRGRHSEEVEEGEEC